MKLFTIFSVLALALPLSLPAANLDAAKRDIYNSDIHVADNARMDLQQFGAENELLAALEKISEKKLRDGIIYSLGKLKSSAAYEKILAIASEELDGCPAAVLAIAEYGTSKSASDLKTLSEKGSKTAKTALWMRGEGGCFMDLSKLKDFDKLDDNCKVAVLGQFQPTADFREFVCNYKAQNKRVAIAQCYALARFDSADDSYSRKIIAIAGTYGAEKSDFAPALAFSKNSEDEIIGLVRNSEEIGIIAAKLRACAEAEPDLLKVYLNAKDAKFKRLRAEALRVVATSETAETLISDFNSIKSEDIPDTVKILTSALERIEGAQRNGLLAKLSESVKSSDEIHKKAAARIVK